MHEKDYFNVFEKSDWLLLDERVASQVCTSRSALERFLPSGVGIALDL